MPISPPQVILTAAFATLALTACGGGGETAPPAAGVTPVPGSAQASTTPAPVTPATLASNPAYQSALAVWRAPRVKGECMSCHGPDFFDLARTGSPDSDISRRGQIDGASPAEVEQLIAGIKLVRQAYSLKPENPRTFRPLQPGGAVLPGASTIERDLAFAGELARFAPTLTSAQPVRTLADARRARDELLAIDFDRMKIGIPFPIWSTDKFHGAAEGNLNDWVADVALTPRPERRAEWLALQDAYLADPSDLNFWKIYFAMPTMTQPFALRPGNLPAHDAKIARVADLKLRNAMIGQHILRTEALGRRDQFLRGAVPFSYLATAEPFRTQFDKESATGGSGERLPRFLPNPIWELGDYARVGFDADPSTAGQVGNISSRDALRDRLANMGYPQFVVDSVDPGLTAGQSETDIRIAWFVMGLRFDPGLQRTHQSNATLLGEYMHANLHDLDYFNHRVFIEAFRLVNRSYRPEASAGTPPPYRLFFGYFAKYNRQMPSRWNSAGNTAVSQDIKNAQLAAYKRTAANFFRMSLLLHEEALTSGAIAPYGANPVNDGEFAQIRAFFDYAGLPGRAEDDALLERVAQRAGAPL
ncbi:hypothetical protein [Erythrobacter donghaensis]|jgi:hypothetical protein|uniref:hypothetical protein n=1 Tax=Erythrobacter donghaensis TaxID=267135 RepID=UPI00093D1775|nr:hypothetical protein [Erythrobacter donghaensis]